MVEPNAAAVRPRPPGSFVRRWAPRFVAFGEFIDGYDLLVVGAAVLFLKPDLHLTAAQTGWIAAVSFIGTAVGLVVFGDLSDRFGRKVIFLINLAFFVVASIASAFVTDVTQLMVARFVVGVAVGMDIPTSASLLAEVAPSARRGRMSGSLPNVMWQCGAIASVLLALALAPVFGNQTWRLLFGIAALPAFAVLLVRQLLPESPRWLRSKGRHEEASRVFAQLGIPEPPPAPTRTRRDYRELLTKRTFVRLAAVTGFFALQSFGGGVATVSGPLVLDSTGIGRQNALYLSLAGYVGGLIAVLVGALIIDRVSRRALGIWTCIGVFLAGQCMAWFGTKAALILIVCYVAYSVLTWLGPGVLAWVWSAEVFPTHLRGLGSGIAQCVTRLSIALNVALVPMLLTEFKLAAIGFYACAYLAAALIVAVSPFLSTTGQSLEAISGSPEGASAEASHGATPLTRL
jgi:MFS transporter, putative metabolite transport protein